MKQLAESEKMKHKKSENDKYPIRKTVNTHRKGRLL